MEYVPYNLRKKILLLSDDMRIPSGVGTISKEIIINTAHVFNWVQIGSMINNPDVGKIIDVSEDIKNHLGYDDIKTLIYPSNGYGNPFLLRQIMDIEKPEIIMIFTDPRYWVWLFEMEYEIHQRGIKIVYYHVWDNVPFSYYNKPYFESCDLIMAISKLSYNNVKYVVGKDKVNELKLDNIQNKKDKNLMLSYVPHGINSKDYFPINENDVEFKTFISTKLPENKENYDFIIFFNSRNIRRKLITDVIMSYKGLCDILKDKKLLLYLHTSVSDQAGTDLDAVISDLFSNYDIIVDEQVYSKKHMNYLYNMANLTISISNAEGFGLSTAESLMAGTPILVNVTGGLQDQCGFKIDDKYITVDDFDEIKNTNNKGQITKLHGDWCYPVFPASTTCNGSIETPYIFDDIVNTEDVTKQLLKAFHDKDNIDNQVGRQYLIENNMDSDSMCKNIVKSINLCLENKIIDKNKINILKV